MHMECFTNTSYFKQKLFIYTSDGILLSVILWWDDHINGALNYLTPMDALY